MATERTGAASRTTEGPPSGYRLRLSVDAIVDAALRIIDAEGVDAVSMRRVAAEFDTGPASLYAHVANKDELLRRAHDRVVAEIAVPDHEDWREVVRGWAFGARALYQQHADLAKLSFANIPAGEPMLRVIETMLEAMIGRGGVPPQIATWALDAMSTYVAADAYEGYLLVKMHGGRADADAHAVVAEMLDRARDSFAQASPQRYPYLMANVSQMMRGDSDERFAFGIDLFISGLERHAAAKETS